MRPHATLSRFCLPKLPSIREQTLCAPFLLQVSYAASLFFGTTYGFQSSVNQLLEFKVSRSATWALLSTVKVTSVLPPPSVSVIPDKSPTNCPFCFSSIPPPLV